ncbi:MAG: nucleotide exchange factor GrpE [Acidobacteriota bacterium]
MTEKASAEEMQKTPSTDAEDVAIPVVDKRRFAHINETPMDAEAQAPPEEETSRYPTYIEELQNRLKQAEEQAEKLQTRFKEAQAQLSREADEMRLRLQRNAEARLEMAKGEIFKQLLEVADNLERAVISGESGADLNTLLTGVKATHTLLLRHLDTAGVKPLIVQGMAFDPNLHEAVDTVEVEPARDGQVIEVYKTGYKLGDRLLRPATVRVGRSQQAQSHIGDLSETDESTA